VFGAGDPLSGRWAALCRLERSRSGRRLAVSVHAAAIFSLAGNDVTPETVVAEIHPRRWFSAVPVAARRSKPRCLSGLLFGRQRAYSVLAGEQRTWGEARRQFPANRGRLRKGVEMFWNIGAIGRHGMQRTAFPNESAPKLVKSQELAEGSPAFDAWLQAYRKHLGEACQRANSLRVSPANANS
jgi:hypothetical protein